MAGIDDALHEVALDVKHRSDPDRFFKNLNAFIHASVDVNAQGEPYASSSGVDPAERFWGFGWLKGVEGEGGVSGLQRDLVYHIRFTPETAQVQIVNATKPRLCTVPSMLEYMHIFTSTWKYV